MLAIFYFYFQEQNNLKNKKGVNKNVDNITCK